MNEASKGRELRNYLGAAVRWIWLLALCTALGAGGAFAVSRIQAPVYRATTLLIVDERSAGQDAYSSVLASDQLVQTYVNLITQPAVLQKAADALGGISAGALAANVRASAQSGTQVIQVQVDDTSPARAAALANAVATAFIQVQQQTAASELANSQQQINQQIAAATTQIDTLTAQINALRASDPASPNLATLQQQLDTALAQRNSLETVLSQLSAQNLSTSNNIRVFQPASPPSAPDHPRPTLNAAIGGVLGLALAIGVVLLLEFLDDRIRTADDIEKISGLATLASVSSRRKRDALLSARDSSRLAESFRILRTNLSFSSLDRPLRTLVVTSAVPGEGKSTVSVNLAISLAQSGKRVLLVDADLRRPAVHKRLGLQNASGLSLRLLGEMSNFGLEYPFATLPDIPNLFILTAGPKPPNPTELLGSERMHQFIQAVLFKEGKRGIVDVVVIDTPPAVAFADASVLAGRADGTILVSNAETSREGQLLRARDALKRVNAHVLGVVLNRVTQKREDNYYYSYYSQEATGEIPAVKPALAEPAVVSAS
ncbi:MAG: polysaccharide biosynthesis tyrosine autokinase, partial [Ktedonobacterales bacterium]